MKQCTGEEQEITENTGKNRSLKKHTKDIKRDGNQEEEKKTRQKERDMERNLWM